MDYVGILMKSARMTWKYKSMWFFGILLGILSGGSGGGTNLQYTLRSQDFDYSGYYGTAESAQQIEKFFNFFTPQVIVTLFLGFLVFMIISIILQYLSRGALIGMVNDIENSGKTRTGQGFRHGWSNWLRLFGISVFIWIPFAVGLILLLGLLVLPVVLAFVKQREILGIVLIFLSIVVFVVLIIVVVIPLSLTHSFAERFGVIENKKLSESISEGYRLFRSNLGNSLLMWLLMVVVNIGLVMVTGIFGVVFLLPVIFIFSTDVLLATVLLIPGVIVFVFVGGLYKTFVFTVWTLFFNELRRKAVPVG